MATLTLPEALALRPLRGFVPPPATAAVPLEPLWAPTAVELVPVAEAAVPTAVAPLADPVSELVPHSVEFVAAPSLHSGVGSAFAGIDQVSRGVHANESSATRMRRKDRSVCAAVAEELKYV